MKSYEKAELLKESIFQLYSKEGRSVSYISKLLGINRRTISKKIKEWNLPVSKPKKTCNSIYSKIYQQKQGIYNFQT